MYQTENYILQKRFFVQAQTRTQTSPAWPCQGIHWEDLGFAFPGPQFWMWRPQLSLFGSVPCRWVLLRDLA